MKSPGIIAVAVALAGTTTVAVAQPPTSPCGPADRAALERAAKEAQDKTFSGDVETGWRLFREKNCIRCHAVWGQGNGVGPDLGRTRTLGHVGAGQLAGIMWNHVPRMWERMEEGGIELTPISPEEMSHLFAFLLFIRYADEPGDPIEGKRVLERHGCDNCHAIDEQGGTVGPDLAKWARFVNPVVWAQKMWSHASQMGETMAQMDIAWPQFSGGDLNNIVAYIRSRAAGEGKEYLAPGSSIRGKRLFETRGCASCHRLGSEEGVGPDLQKIDLPSTLSGIASQMWNHAPGMLAEIRRRGEKVQPLEAQEMADIIVYLLTRRYFLAEGDPKNGWKVFFKKQCVSCHAIDDWGGNVGPRLNPLQGKASPIFMAQAMWCFGPTMLAEMTARGIPWPHFEGSEMADLIAFLNQETAEGESR